jgi:hypothetical protein
MVRGVESDGGRPTCFDKASQPLLWAGLRAATTTHGIPKGINYFILVVYSQCGRGLQSARVTTSK